MSDRRGEAWVYDPETNSGRLVDVWVRELGPGRVRMEPINEADKEPFLASMRAGHSISLTTNGLEPDDQKEFAEGWNEGMRGTMLGAVQERLREKLLDSDEG